MGHEFRLERRRVRWFFAGLLVVSGVLDIVGALLVQHQTRSQVLEALLPASITLGGRTGAVLSGLAPWPSAELLVRCLRERRLERRP